ncbi:MAG: sugar ABC transporter permease [Planctomycetes bacterium]|nr:sugar ABC transporter permease [Planctomycetota bacterium]
MNATRSTWRGYLFVAPATVYLMLFSFLPMLVAAYLSLHRWHLLSSVGGESAGGTYVGLSNYVELAGNPFFRNAIANTLYFVVLSVPLGVASALAIALLVSRPLPGMPLFRTLFYVPAVSSGVAISMVWIWVFLPDVGLINYMLRLLGFEGSTDFLNDTRWAMPALVLVSVWVGLGPRMVIFLAGLQGIPGPLYEAASLDGCGALRRFRHITLPMLSPTMLFVLVTSTISAFQLFTHVYMMTKGGPRRTTEVLAYTIYKEAWQKFELGMASAQSYVLFLLTLILSLVQLRLMRRGLRGMETC